MNTKHHQKWAALAVAPLLVFASSAYSQQSSTNGTQNTLGQVAPAKQVYGHQVMSSDNQKIGNLNNLVVDLESGRILYGVLADGNNRVAVPPEIFTQTSPANNELRLSATKQKVDGAPKFGPVDKPGQWGSAAFVSQVYSYFGQNPWWQGSAPANVGSFNDVHKANQVAGMKVNNVNNAPIGTVKDIAVDLPAGRVVVLTLAPDSSLNLGNNLYPMPPQAFTLSHDQKNLVSNIDAAKLAGAPHFTADNWPNLSDQNYVSQIYQYYGKQPWFGTQPTGR
ncbi:MAG TPA: PRC-barrel domain-containing protein [Verrucomicrobiae bacterium]|nr:PRC-barrel domain-containing protein [Verrucomicrobiae bacterium]